LGIPSRYTRPNPSTRPSKIYDSSAALNPKFALDSRHRWANFGFAALVHLSAPTAPASARGSRENSTFHVARMDARVRGRKSGGGFPAFRWAPCGLHPFLPSDSPLSSAPRRPSGVPRRGWRRKRRLFLCLDRTSAANPKFASYRGKSGCELRVQSGTRIIDFLVSLLIPRLASIAPQGWANLGIGTLGCRSEPTSKPS
jgi:hypothetical protein